VAAPSVGEDEVEFSAIRAQGPGGQNVKKVSSAVHLRFKINESSLSSEVKARLLSLPGRRVSKEGVLVIKAQAARSQEQNRVQAMLRLNKLVSEAAQVESVRRPTKPSYRSRLRRLESKAQRGAIKAARGKVET
jgi:ribosome-associated protein